ncbi:MAG: hypothetical protein QM831_26320 [Kofleriaceae bacterium]
MKRIALVLLVVAACGGKKGVPCDNATVKALADKLDKNDKSILDTSISLAGCKFHGQGNDLVWLTASNGDAELRCHMKGGEDGVTTFRHAAMASPKKPDELSLDVTGKVAASTEKYDHAYQLTNCEIAVK